MTLKFRYAAHSRRSLAVKMLQGRERMNWKNTSYPQAILWGIVEKRINCRSFCKVFHVIHNSVWKTEDEAVSMCGEMRGKLSKTWEKLLKSERSVVKRAAFGCKCVILWAKIILKSVEKCGKGCGISGEKYAELICTQKKVDKKREI